MERQFTASVYILNQDKILLIFHRKLQKWLQPGGHIDPNEIPSEAAVREAREETGLEVEIILQENIWVNHWNAKSFERPYLCQLQEIPAYKDQPAHQHMDFQYLARPIGGQENQNVLETDGLHWFTLEEIESLKPDVDIFKETQEVLRSIFNSQFALEKV